MPDDFPPVVPKPKNFVPIPHRFRKKYRRYVHWLLRRGLRYISGSPMPFPEEVLANLSVTALNPLSNEALAQPPLSMEEKLRMAAVLSVLAGLGFRVPRSDDDGLPITSP